MEKKQGGNSARIKEKQTNKMPVSRIERELIKATDGSNVRYAMA